MIFQTFLNHSYLNYSLILTQSTLWMAMQLRCTFTNPKSISEKSKVSDLSRLGDYFTTHFVLLVDYVKKYASEDALREQDDDSDSSESTMSDFSDDETKDMEMWTLTLNSPFTWILLNVYKFIYNIIASFVILLFTINCFRCVRLVTCAAIYLYSLLTVNCSHPTIPPLPPPCSIFLYLSKLCSLPYSYLDVIYSQLRLFPLLN